MTENDHDQKCPDHNLFQAYKRKQRLLIIHENTKRKAKTCIREKYYLFLQANFNIKWKRHNTSE